VKRILIIIAVCVVAYYAVIGPHGSWSPGREPAVVGDDHSIAAAVRSQASNVQVEGEGIVIKQLPDDLQGDRHQRILLRLASGGTLLIAHNIDLAPRLEGLREGETVQFYGVFEWNEKGGVVHWTHYDPKGHHLGGWLKYRGRTFQ